ncbi:MAG: hypothetical protein ACKN82_03670, partial [Pirellula sp.]
NVTEEKVEKYTVQVPTTVQEEIDVTVCKMVAQTVSVPVWSNGTAVGADAGAGSWSSGAASGAWGSAGSGAGIGGLLGGRGLLGKHLGGGLGCGSRKAAAGASAGSCGSAAGSCGSAAAASDCGCN